MHISVMAQQDTVSVNQAAGWHRLSHSLRVKVATVIFATAASALVLVKYPVEMNEKVGGEISDTVGLETWHSLHQGERL